MRRVGPETKTFGHKRTFTFVPERWEL